MNDDTFFYRTPIDTNEINNTYFILPKTYFVQILDSANEDFYSASYMNISGYVKKDSVQAISGIPNNPYLSNVTFRVYAEMSQNLRTSPSKQDSNLIINIPILTKNILLIGKIDGECLIDGRTSEWFYCRYIGDSIYEGYVYSDFCDEITKAQDNTEIVTFIPNPTFEEIQETPNSLSINNSLVAIVIGVLSIPALIFAIMIFKSKQILSLNNQKEIIDYYNRTDL